MVEHALSGRTILIAEDEYLLAMELKRELVRAGALVVGPAGSLPTTLRLIEEAGHLDGAVLDVNLQGEKVYAAADLLLEQGVPILLASGYDQSTIPERFKHVARCEKPIAPGAAALQLASALKGGL